MNADLILNLSADEYHAPQLGRVSKSALDQLHRSPAHYREWLAGETTETAALAFGRAFHMALLEPARFAKHYVVEPTWGDCRKKENKAQRDAWREEHADAEQVSQKCLDTIGGMVASARRHPLAANAIRNGIAESTARWTDEETGLPCQVRPDYYVESLAMIVDVKSADDGSFDGFRRAVAKYRYHVQDALYREGVRAAGKPVEHFVFVVVEKSPPHAVSLFQLDAEGQEAGWRAMRRNVDTMAHCVRTSTWPGYPETIQELDLPPWAA